jgi:hypothetical protein
VNYNKHKDIKNWSKKYLLLYSPFKNSKNSLLGTLVAWHDVYCEVKENIYIIRSKFNYNMQNKHTNEEYDVMNLKSNYSHPQNIGNDDIGDTCPLIPITNTLNIEKCDLKNDFIIQSCNTLDCKRQNFEDDGFTILSNSMIMDELKYRSMLRQLNEEQRLIFDDIMYRKQMYHNIPIHIF